MDDGHSISFEQLPGNGILFWKDVSESHPQSPFHVVLITDGDLVCLAYYIQDAKSWYGEDLLDENGELLDEQFHTSHWNFITEGPFSGNDECFGEMGDITHWMDLPLPPKNNCDLTF